MVRYLNTALRLQYLKTLESINKSHLQLETVKQLEELELRLTYDAADVKLVYIQ